MKRQLLYVMAGWILLLPVAGFSHNVLAFKDKDPTVTAAPSDKKDSELQQSDISRFTSAIDQIKSYYVQDVSDRKLLEDAIRGMLNGLDPHSEYLDQNAYKSLLMTTNGSFGGLGIEVTGEYGVLKVISPIDDTPAAKAGILPGDYIVAINKSLVDEMTLDEAVDKMRGPKGTSVTLTILRKDHKAPLKFTLIRDTIHIANVKSRLFDNQFGYIRISEFAKPTTELTISAIDSLKKQAGGHLNGLILDLRNNPGGLLETAVQIADLFLDSKKLKNRFNHLIVYTEGRLPGTQFNGTMTTKSQGSDIIGNAPLVILVNEGSASASEIVTGALQDYDRAIVVGTTTFGKGSVQTVLPLDNSHAIKLTTALYHTPSGRLIQNKGIQPDITVTNMEIAGNNTDKSLLLPVREFELKGHLQNKTAANNTTDTASQQEKMLALARSDFQLYEALSILTTMYTVQKDKDSSSAKMPRATSTASTH